MTSEATKATQLIEEARDVLREAFHAADAVLVGVLRLLPRDDREQPHEAIGDRISRLLAEVDDAAPVEVAPDRVEPLVGSERAYAEDDMSDEARAWRSTRAQSGGSDPAADEEALASIETWNFPDPEIDSSGGFRG